VDADERKRTNRWRRAKMMGDDGIKIAMERKEESEEII
jgi:hypothetical protein